MRVMHLFSSKTFAGLERHVEELAYAQTEKHDVQVIGPANFKERFRANYKVINTNQWRLSPILCFQIKKAIHDFQPDIIHSHAYKTTAIISKLKNKEFQHVATIHGTKKKTDAFEKAAFIFGASSKSLNNINNPQKEVLENWVDESRFYNFEKGSPQRYIYVGRLEPVKNPLRLLKAWKNINHKLDIYGDGSLKSKIIDFIKQNTLTDRVRLMGEEDDVKNIYANTSGVLISSDREGSPKVLFEALFCNIPVISTSVGIMPDLLPSACLSESNDESFKELLEFTIPKIDEIHESCITLFNEAKTKYTLKNQNERVEEIYRTLLSNASR